MWKKAQASEASNASLQASLKKEGRESGASASAGDSASANASDLASCTWLGELEVVRRTRPKAQPNIGFAAELRRYERELRAAMRAGTAGTPGTTLGGTMGGGQ
jgi:hypothetical protein